MRENDVMRVFEQLAVMLLQRRLAPPNHLRLLPHVPPDDPHPDDPDEHKRHQEEQRPE